MKKTFTKASKRSLNAIENVLLFVTGFQKTIIEAVFP